MVRTEQRTVQLACSWQFRGVVHSLEVGEVDNAIPDDEGASTILMDSCADVVARVHRRSDILDLAIQCATQDTQGL